MPTEQLDRAAVAARLGVQIKTVDVYRQRPEMGFPEPDGHVGRSPWWRATTIARWDKRRAKLPANRVTTDA